MVYLLLCRSCILNWDQGSIQQLSLSIFHSVEMRFWTAASISFFCESWSNIESSNSPSFVCAAFYVFNPFFFFNRCFVNLLVSIVLERDVAVLMVARVWTLSILIFIFCATQVFCFVVFIGPVFSLLNLFVSPFRLYDEAKHFALRWLNHSFMLCCEGPSSRRSSSSVIPQRRTTEVDVWAC